MLCCLIVHNVQFYLESFLLEHVEILFVGVEYYYICRENGVGFVVVHHKITYATVDRHKWDIPCHVVVHYSRVFVGKYSKTKYIGNRLVAIVWDGYAVGAALGVSVVV